MIVDDVIAVRFLSKPYREIENLRIGSPLIVTWLTNVGIQYSNQRDSLIFTLPSKYNPLITLDEHVIEALKPVRSLLRSELLKIDAHFLRHVTMFSIPLTTRETIGLYDLIGQKLSFIKFSK